MRYFRNPMIRSGSRGLVVRRVLVAVTFVLLSILSKQSFSPKAVAYKVVREAVKFQTNLKTTNWLEVTNNHFYVRYKSEDASVVKMVLDTAEMAYSPVNQMLGNTMSAKIPIVLYPDKASFNKSFGWDADQSAMGVYWAGVIRILSPNEWARGDTYQSKQNYFNENGPMAHEYVHLVVDYKTGGNYPRWFTEGIAQYVEREITGFQFKVPEINEKDDLYLLSRMDGQFDLLPSQSIAYWQSLAMVEYLIKMNGIDKINDLMDLLGEGYTFTTAFEEVYQTSLHKFESVFGEYIINEI